jgi:chemotaxis protein methyltransferase CheR
VLQHFSCCKGIFGPDLQINHSMTSVILAIRNGAPMLNVVQNIVKTAKDLYGIELSQYDEAFLRQTIERRFEVVETKDLQGYIAYLANSETEARTLARSLNITYTEFFRNALTFAHLEQWLLPNLIDKKPSGSELRVWSAGCSTGQEAYSIAMMLENELEKGRKAFRYRIIATDISESALTQAIIGAYSEESIQTVRVRDINRFFERSENIYTVCDKLKQHISFSRYDLLDPLSANPQESIFGNFDLVICSNVLYYYKPKCQSFILKKLVNSLVGNGYLITGEAERQNLLKNSILRAIVPPSPIFQKKAEV